MHRRGPRIPQMIVDRFHAYESAASYTMEGMVQWLLSGEPWAVAALRTYVFHVIPMANPDGVVNGMGRLTAPQGADLVFWPATSGQHAPGHRGGDGPCEAQTACDPPQLAEQIDLRNRSVQWRN